MTARTATILIDGREHQVQAGDNLLHACLSLGLELPYFCWHPALGSVGACRQCAVKHYHDEHDPSGRLVMACMTPATEGMRISIEDAEASAFRASVIEWLMTNHPHDCPVCEEGGECHLQDMTHLTGHVYRRYRFTKRTYRNQYLGPFIKHEMNRCIACYRCVRFYRDYAGGRDLDVFGSHRFVYFGRHSDGVLESEFSGNLVEVCPTGVFTDKTLSARYTRKWDLAGSASVCAHCGLGCNIFPNARYGELRRVINRYHHDINGYFLCDRGRFGYGFVNEPTRVRLPLRTRATPEGRVREPTTRALAIEQLALFMREAALANAGPMLGIGSPRASLESNFALRELVGPENFHLGVADQDARLLAVVLALLRTGAAPIATLREAEQADAVLVLGEDVPNTAPRLALALRQMVRQASLALAPRLKVPQWQDAAVRDLGHDERSPLFIVTTDATRLDDAATLALRLAPDEAARFGFTVAHLLTARQQPPALSESLASAAERIAQLLGRAERPLIVTGTGSGSEALLHAAAAVAAALRGAGREARWLLTVPECNSLGLALMGGQPLSAALQALGAGRASGAVVLENDLYRRADRSAVDAALDHCRHLVVLDHALHATAERAELVLPAATFAEASGTLVNNEPRAQRFFQLLFSQDEVAASWRWLNDAACESGRAQRRWASLDEAIAALGTGLPALAAIAGAAPAGSYRIAGSRIATSPHRESGRTAMHADRTVHEPPPPSSADSPYNHSMEGYYGEMPAAAYPFFWTPDWNSEQGLNRFQQEVGGPLRGGDAGVRLIASAPAAAAASAEGPVGGSEAAIPAAFEPRPGQWLIVPAYRVFGSDELSARSPAVRERIGPARLGLHPADAAQLGISQGDAVQLLVQNMRHSLTAELRTSLPRGVATLTVGLPGVPWMPLPAWAELSRVGP